MDNIILNWLIDHGVSESIIKEAGISFDGQRIVIPVKDENGKFLFNKMRRNPLSEIGPKYEYQAGATATLFNAHSINGKKDEVVFITEGEIKCLHLNSLGLNAVSSTGGANTFKPEWVELLGDNEIYIVLDKDEPGIRGALKINTLIPSAKIIFLPEKMKGKDITTYFQTHTMRDFQELVTYAQPWLLPQGTEFVPTNKKEREQMLKVLNEEDTRLEIKKHEFYNESKPYRHIEIMREELAKRIENIKSYKEFNPKKEFGDDVSRAKSVPISNYIKIERSGFVKCLWHNETVPSAKYYPKSNTGFCFGCNKRFDVIDVIQKLKQVEFKEAVKILLGN
jgi:DNA primase